MNDALPYVEETHRMYAGTYDQGPGPACAASPKGTKELIWVHGQWSGDMMIDGVRGCPVVAGSADHEGLASPFRHELGPRWLWSSRLGEVGESADVVHVHLGLLLAELTAARPDPGDELLALAAGRAGDGEAVDQDRHLLPP